MRYQKADGVKVGHAGYQKVRVPNGLPCGCRSAYEYTKGAGGYTGEVTLLPGGWRICRHGHVWGLKLTFELHHTLDLGTNGLARNGLPVRSKKKR